MKKIILLSVLFFAINFGLKSQQMWFDAGLKGAYGPTMLINKNVMDERNLTQKITTGFGYGGKFAINFGYIHGITFDFMLNTAHQGYDYTKTNETLDVDWQTKDIYVLYRLYRTINYMEIGPKFSKVSYFRNNDIDTDGNYVESYPSAVLGFGWYIFGNKSFTATMGLRFEYAFNDILNKTGKENGYPVNPYRTTSYDDYTTTNPFIAQLSFEINWGLGYFAKTACGGRRHFFSF